MPEASGGVADEFDDAFVFDHACGGFGDEAVEIGSIGDIAAGVPEIGLATQVLGSIQTPAPPVEHHQEGILEYVRLDESGNAQEIVHSVAVGCDGVGEAERDDRKVEPIDAVAAVHVDIIHLVEALLLLAEAVPDVDVAPEYLLADCVGEDFPTQEKEATDAVAAHDGGETVDIKAAGVDIEAEVGIGLVASDRPEGVEIGGIDGEEKRSDGVAAVEGEQILGVDACLALVEAQTVENTGAHGVGKGVEVAAVDTDGMVGGVEAGEIVADDGELGVGVGDEEPDCVGGAVVPAEGAVLVGAHEGVELDGVALAEVGAALDGEAVVDVDVDRHGEAVEAARAAQLAEDDDIVGFVGGYVEYDGVAIILGAVNDPADGVDGLAHILAVGGVDVDVGLVVECEFLPAGVDGIAERGPCDGQHGEGVDGEVAVGFADEGGEAMVEGGVGGDNDLVVGGDDGGVVAMGPLVLEAFGGTQPDGVDGLA